MIHERLSPANPRFPGVRSRANLNALAAHLAYMYCPHPDTALDGIHKLDPGTSLLVDAEGQVVRQARYWTFRYDEDASRRSRERVDEVRHALFDAVRRQMPSRRKLGLFRSGGMDTSSVAAACRTVAPERPFTALCSAVEQGDGFVQDLPYAAHAARALRLDFVPVDVASISLAGWSDVLWHLEEPQADPAVYLLGRICERARALDLPVLFSGAGGDDVFAGERRSLLPGAILHRPKSGFGVPLRKWLAGPMRADVSDCLSSREFRERGWFVPREVERLWEETLSGRTDGSYTVWALVTAEAWARRFNVS